MNKTRSSSKKVSIAQLNNHEVTNKRQALKDLKTLDFDSLEYKNKHKQFYFNCAYFLGFSGALQGIITVDLTGIFTFSDMLTLHLQHSLIILNVLWLIFAYNYKFTKKSIFQAFLFTNILVVVVSFINYVIDSNYMFLCSPPDVKNPLLIGDWPYYILVLELVFFIYGYILYLPFKLREIFITKD